MANDTQKTKMVVMETEQFQFVVNFMNKLQIPFGLAPEAANVKRALDNALIADVTIDKDIKDKK